MEGRENPGGATSAKNADVKIVSVGASTRSWNRARQKSRTSTAASAAPDPSTARPRSEIITMMPAKSTARPLDESLTA